MTESKASTKNNQNYLFSILSSFFQLVGDLSELRDKKYRDVNGEIIISVRILLIRVVCRVAIFGCEEIRKIMY